MTPPRALRVVAMLAGLSLCAVGGTASAQVFIASKPRPDFWIAPVFVSATVRGGDATSAYDPLPITVSWSVAPPPNRTPDEIAQDLFLLWPGEVVATAGVDGADAVLARQVRDAGFEMLGHGQLHLSARSRLAMGTAAGTGVRALGDAPFVIFTRPDGPARGVRAATLVRIPWKPELASLDWLARIDLPARRAIVPKRVTWLEESFWGQRQVITISFGDVGSASVYPLYFGARDRVIPLARDFSMLAINFADAQHLKVDDVVPMSANRRMSETREDTETISLPLVAAEALTPQVLKVQFIYFRGRLPWRPILISGLLLGLGNLTGPLFAALARRVARTLRNRIHLGRGGASERESGAVPAPEVLERVRPGVTTYDEVLRLCGDPEEERRLPSGEIRSIVYRGRRVRPRRQRSFGWFATVSQWDVEHQEVQIDFENDRVRNVEAGIRRIRLAEPATAP